jgi:hypothetical protein
MERPDPPPPAWYADPENPDLARHWDGQEWGRETRPLPRRSTPTVAASSATVPAKPRANPRGRRSSAAILLVAIGFFLVAGLYNMVAGTSASTSNPNRFAAPTTIAPSAPTATAALPTPSRQCALAAVRYTAPMIFIHLVRVDLRGFLLLRPPSSSTTTTTTTATAVAVPSPLGTSAPLATRAVVQSDGSCTSVAFTDSRGAGTGRIIVFATDGAAHRAATTGHYAPNAVAIGNILLALPGTLSAQLPTYEAAISTYRLTVKGSL